MKTRNNFYLDEADMEALKKIAESKGLSVSSLLRMIIKEYIKKQNK